MSEQNAKDKDLHLTTTERQALDKYRENLLARFPDQIQRLILYGSKARGDDTEESDIDVVVVVEWDERELGNGFWQAMYSDPRWQAIVCMASDVSLEHNVLLSPHVIGHNRFLRWSPLVGKVKREGIELWRRN